MIDWHEALWSVGCTVYGFIVGVRYMGGDFLRRWRRQR